MIKWFKEAWKDREWRTAIIDHSIMVVAAIVMVAIALATVYDG